MSIQSYVVANNSYGRLLHDSMESQFVGRFVRLGVTPGVADLIFLYDAKFFDLEIKVSGISSLLTQHLQERWSRPDTTRKELTDNPEHPITHRGTKRSAYTSGSTGPDIE